MGCVHCGREVEPEFRYCPWCGVVQRRKLVDFFSGHPLFDAGRTLRVSRYIRTRDQEPHVRFSVWDEHGEARGVVSLTEDEAARVGAFLRAPRTPRQPNRLWEALERLGVHGNT